MFHGKYTCQKYKKKTTQHTVIDVLGFKSLLERKGYSDTSWGKKKDKMAILRFRIFLLYKAINLNTMQTGTQRDYYKQTPRRHIVLNLSAQDTPPCFLSSLTDSYCTGFKSNQQKGAFSMVLNFLH